MNGPDLPPLREVIARHGLDARKALGQHFLLDPNLTDRIARQAGDMRGCHVVEIGPGPGGLTRSLLGTDAASVVAVELDRRAIAALADLVDCYPDRLRVVEGDALRLDLAGLSPAPRRMVANLPYNAASPILVRLLREASSWLSLTLMFQQEVAERICARPGEDAYGRLGVLAQLVCDVDIRMRIPPTAFVPPPKVWSAVVQFSPHPDQPSGRLFSAMERVTAAAFGQRRKMLRGALKTLGGAALLDRAGIASDRRAETLTVEEFARLANMIGGSEFE